MSTTQNVDGRVSVEAAAAFESLDAVDKALAEVRRTMEGHGLPTVARCFTVPELAFMLGLRVRQMAIGTGPTSYVTECAPLGLFQAIFVEGEPRSGRKGKAGPDAETLASESGDGAEVGDISNLPGGELRRLVYVESPTEPRALAVLREFAERTRSGGQEESEDDGLPSLPLALPRRQRKSRGGRTGRFSTRPEA